MSLFSMFPLDPVHNITRCHPLAKCPILRYLPICKFHIRVFLLLFLSNWLNIRLWLLIVYAWIVVYYDFAFCGILLFFLPKDSRIHPRLYCAFWLQFSCQVSSHGPSHLGSGQATMTTTDVSCYCHCDHYFSSGEFQCWLIIIKLLPQLSEWVSPSCPSNAITLPLLQAY